MVQCPGGSPMKSMCVPVGSVALGVRSQLEGRCPICWKPLYGFGTTHTLSFPVWVAACGVTTSDSTSDLRPSVLFVEAGPVPQSPLVRVLVQTESNAVTE